MTSKTAAARVELEPSDLTDLRDIGPDDPFPKLLPWQRVYAGWLTGFEGRPNQTIRLKQAAIAANYQIKKDELGKLEKRADFVAFCADLQADEVMAARKLAETEAVTTIRQFFEMRDAAHKAGDYKEFVRYATPILDRVWPKSEDGAKVAKTQVIINMGQGSFAAKVHQEGETIETTDVLVLSNPDDVEVE